MHGFDAETEALGAAILTYAQKRMRLHPVPLDGPRTLEELQAVAGNTITTEGMGGLAALKLFGDELALACLSNDHPRYLSFIPCAPTEAAVMFELVVGASGIYAGSWLEGSGAVYAENVALRWIADLAGLPPQAGGVFVPGGTIGNLSALVTARWAARARHTESGFSRGHDPPRWRPRWGRTPRSGPRARSWTPSSWAFTPMSTSGCAVTTFGSC